MRYYPLFTQENLPKTLVIANGAFPKAPTPLALIDRWRSGEEGYSLTCCDGAVNKLRQYTDKLPDAVVGDLDSVSSGLKDLLDGRIHHFPDQDTNDLTKTMKFIHSQGGQRPITLLGASGGREDHLLANLCLLTTYSELVSDLVMLTDEGYFLLLTEPSEVEILLGQQFSVFNFQQTPISLRGAHWPLDHYTLPQLWCGSLNRASASRLSIDTTSPILLYLANV